MPGPNDTPSPQRFALETIGLDQAAAEPPTLSWFGLEKPQRMGLILGYVPFAESELRRAASRFRQAIQR